MQEIQISDKEKYLRLRYPFTDIPSLTDKRRCIQCGHDFIVGDYKVFKDANGYETIRCPYAPACDGTVIDWYKTK